MSETVKAAESGPKGGTKPPKEPATSELVVVEAEARASAARLQAVRAAVDAAAEEQYRATAKEIKAQKPADTFTDKRSGDVIFRRELGEPEFWLDKKDRVPSHPILSADEAQEISKRVEIPIDNTPKYDPQYILSKEFGGSSNYEIGIKRIRQEAQRRLDSLKDSGAGGDEIRLAQESLEKLDHLYENYHIGMNVFRTAKGGRDRIKK